MRHRIRYSRIREFIGTTADMPTYRAYFFGPAGQIVAVRVLRDCVADREALATAAGLLASPATDDAPWTAVEVWDLARIVGKIQANEIADPPGVASPVAARSTA